MKIDDVRKIADGLRDSYSTDTISVGIAIHEEPLGTFHITCQGGSYQLDDITKLGRLGKSALDAFARGKTAFVRVQPELISGKEGPLGRDFICSYVRFSFVDEPGEWLVRADPPAVSQLGFAKA